MIPYEPRSPESVWSESGTAFDQMFYTAGAWNERASSRIIGGPASMLIPSESGRCSIRGMRP